MCRNLAIRSNCPRHFRNNQNQLRPETSKARQTPNPHKTYTKNNDPFNVPYYTDAQLAKRLVELRRTRSSIPQRSKIRPFSTIVDSMSGSRALVGGGDSGERTVKSSTGMYELVEGSSLTNHPSNGTKSLLANQTMS